MVWISLFQRTYGAAAAFDLRKCKHEAEGCIVGQTAPYRIAPHRAAPYSNAPHPRHKHSALQWIVSLLASVLLWNGLIICAQSVPRTLYPFRMATTTVLFSCTLPYSPSPTPLRIRTVRGLCCQSGSVNSHRSYEPLLNVHISMMISSPVCVLPICEHTAAVLKCSIVCPFHHVPKSSEQQ